MQNGSNKQIVGSVPSQQLEANAFLTIQHASIKAQVMEEDNGTHNAEKPEQAENHSLASMPTTEIVSF